MTEYKIIKNIDGKECAVFRFADNTSIPFDPANTDYQAFLRWCDEGNVPEPADEVITSEPAP
jgi:hypothetical protein